MEKTIIFDLLGGKVKDHICRSSGHGYYAYTNVHDPMIIFILKRLCIWHDSTETIHMRDGGYFKKYELDCGCYDFIMTPEFKSICDRFGVKPVFCTEENIQDLRDFYDNIQRR